MNIKMADVFTSTTGVCMHVNLSCLHDFRNDGVTPFDMIDKAVSEYDENQALITKQADQIKMLREALHSMVRMVDEDLLGDCDSMHAEMVFTEAEAALEATKEQA